MHADRERCGNLEAKYTELLSLQRLGATAHMRPLLQPREERAGIFLQPAATAHIGEDEAEYQLQHGFEHLHPLPPVEG